MEKVQRARRDFNNCCWKMRHRHRHHVLPKLQSCSVRSTIWKVVKKQGIWCSDGPPSVKEIPPIPASAQRDTSTVAQIVQVGAETLRVMPSMFVNHA